MRKVTAVLVVMGALGAPTGPAEAGPPLRSGTIIGGWSPFAAALAPSGPPRCTWNVECLAWVQSGCHAALAGRDPGLHASIVDVRSLARSRHLRSFVTRQDLPGIMWGGVALQFFTSRCVEVEPSEPIPKGIAAWWFRMPRRAAWMTVATADDTTFRWELR